MPHTVLIADRSTKRRKRALNALEKAGYRCLTVGTGTEALAAAARYSPHLAVIQSDLPEVEGTDVCLRIKQESPETAVIILTSAANEQEEFVAGEVGADAYFPSPDDPRKIVEHVREFFGRAAAD